MREIKFRAWNKKLKEMREIAMMEFDDTGRSERIKVWDHPSASTAKIKSQICVWLKKDCEILEFTGLLDSSQKEIYEGYIVRNGFDNNFTIGTGWAGTDEDTSPGCYVMSPITSNDDIYALSPSEARDCEIIGNIYENPKLLNKPKNYETK